MNAIESEERELLVDGARWLRPCEMMKERPCGGRVFEREALRHSHVLSVKTRP